jgi:hypothetical protein
MVDYISAMLTGLFTGIGVYVANYLGEKHLRNRLDNSSNIFNEIKKIFSGKK